MSETQTTVPFADHKTALGKIASQTTRITQLEKQLTEATDALLILRTKFDAAENAEKDDLINKLEKDSNGKLTKEYLAAHTLSELYLVQDALTVAEPKGFVSVMQQREKDAEEKKPLGTVGYLNPDTKKWEGGV